MFHAVVVWNGIIYDPAYGQTYLTLEEWETKCLAGIWKGTELNPLIRKDVDGQLDTRLVDFIDPF